MRSFALSIVAVSSALALLGVPAPAAPPAEAVPAHPPSKARLRPWLQDFNLGARYDAAKVLAQIKATKEALGDKYAGFLVWAPSNVYTRQALE